MTIIFAQMLASRPDFSLWIRLGTGKNTKNIHVNTLCGSVGRQVSQGIPFFYAFTGCNTTSAFKGKAKKSAWNTWKACDFVTEVFCSLSQSPFSEIDRTCPMFIELQMFLVRLYSKNVQASKVNEARKLIFSMNQNLEKIPPTEDALLQHVKRAIFQTG